MHKNITDLTHTLREGMVGHPSHGRTPIRLAGSLNHWAYKGTPRLNPYNGAELSFANEQWVLNGNTGTHMDSVWHVDPDTEFSAERMPIECGYGPAVWLDCSSVYGPGGQVTPEVLEQAEASAGVRVDRDDIVLIHTGWSNTVDADPKAYINQHMGLTKEAGEWLRGRGVRTVGIDCSTVETTEGASSSPVHTNFMKPTVLGLEPDDFIAIIENLVNIDQIPAHRFEFIGLPLPFEGGSGSPIRAMAVVS